ncbi:hypothetical protein BGHDH14_bghG000516000001001 [Blumeria hordei DH14]|uniref:Uncharacterized protein n=1 Tax=Blumeria graminis f. sp. hordei (strain DH14) TaxID=546991 RepID=N1J523_BLUG1|nr:hypothetical protein BGHDH14_bghG000516000001001 [Blumeria hordei DH14]
MKRLVVVGSDSGYSHYGVYNPGSGSQFPQIEDEYDITTTRNRVGEPGTYVRAYCSFSLKERRIVEIITSSLNPVTAYSHRGFGVTHQAEMDCLKKINEILITHADESSLSLREILRNRQCPDGVIASLAFQNLLSIVGEYRYFSSLGRGEGIKVNADTPLAMASVISPDQFVGEETRKTGQTALAWYVGHLFVFERHEILWRPKTKIGEQLWQGHDLEMKLLNHFHQPRQFKKFLDTIRAQVEISGPCDLPYTCDLRKVAGIKMAAFAALPVIDLGMLPAITPDGALG